LFCNGCGNGRILGFCITVSPAGTVVDNFGDWRRLLYMMRITNKTTSTMARDTVTATLVEIISVLACFPKTD
jgi:hypothetical protein